MLVVSLASMVFGVVLWEAARSAWAPRQPSPTSVTADASAHDHAEANEGDAEGEDVVWTCSMHPQIRSPKPGKCPICAMDLIPVKTTTGALRTITVSPEAAKLMQLETRPVERRFVTATIRMVGKVDYDETRLAYITAWISGRLDRLFADYTGVQVRPGDHVALIYSEELYAAQVELIQAIRQRRNQPQGGLIQSIDMVAAAREKLRLLGLTADQITEIETRMVPSDHVTIYSPIGGIVVEKLRQEGDRVRIGDRIYTVADLTHVWVKLDAYESDIEWLRYGQDVEFTTEAYPGEVFHGRIVFMDPVLDPVTRTIKVRVNVDNEDGRLKPEMFVRAVVRARIAAGGKVLDAEIAGKWMCPMHPEVIHDDPGACDICGMPLVRPESLGYAAIDSSETIEPLVIPASAPLLTGTRAIVYVQDPDADEPTFEGREIVLGPRAGDYYLVRSGLKEGEFVVTHGNFKLDSALQILAKPSMMTPEGGGVSSGEERVVSSELKGTLRRLWMLRDRLRRALREQDLAVYRQTFGEVGVTLDQVDADSLVGESKVHWNEFAMLLTNDVTEGTAVRDFRDADRILATYGAHLDQAGTYFAVVPEPPKPGETAVPTTPEFRARVTTLWKAYSAVCEALAADDIRQALAHARDLEATLQSIDASGLSGIAAEAWNKEKADFAKLTSLMAKAEDIVKLRETFSPVSDEMYRIVRRFGVEGVSIYRHHCPMAFDGRGAYWLQPDDQTRNPYYGATMLRCADSVEPVVELQ
ncbi:efflux RND transporter periplasmic adaptor subunit [Thermostilla marina]